MVRSLIRPGFACALACGVLATGACALACGVLATGASAGAAASVPLPTLAKGAKLEVIASGVSTPTAFAFGAGQVFMTDGTTPPGTGGGVYVIKHGAADPLSGSPPLANGITWHDGTLYISATALGASGSRTGELLAWSGWNGTGFSHQKLIYTAPPTILLNGLAFGANGRLYVGVDVGETNDHGPKQGLLYDILSFNPGGQDMKVFATGMRQPWQFAFPAGSSSPFVTDLGQDKPESIQTRVPDFLLRVRPGQNYGFPACNWIVPRKCRKFATPYKILSPHTDPGGLGLIGTRLYMSEFGFGGTARVQWQPLGGGPLKTLLTGFTGETLIALGTHDGWIYVGELDNGPGTGTGRVFRIKP